MRKLALQLREQLTHAGTDRFELACGDVAVAGDADDEGRIDGIHAHIHRFRSSEAGSLQDRPGKFQAGNAGLRFQDTPEPEAARRRGGSSTRLAAFAGLADEPDLLWMAGSPPPLPPGVGAGGKE